MRTRWMPQHRFPANGLVDESFDLSADYVPGMLDISDAAVEAGFPGEPYFYVEAGTYPKVRFRLGDLNVDFGRGIDTDEPFDGWWAACWDDVTSIPLDIWLTGDREKEVVAAMIDTLLEAGLATRSSAMGGLHGTQPLSNLSPTKHQREVIDKEVTW